MGIAAVTPSDRGLLDVRLAVAEFVGELVRGEDLDR